MSHVVGLVTGALAVLASIVVHEAGHLVAAKALGMRVTRYFLGFGPTLWSIHRGDTQYGVKAIPFGGSTAIAGMSADGDGAQDPAAMWRSPLWHRTVALAAGPGIQLLFAYLLLWILAGTLVLPNPPTKGRWPHPTSC